MKIIKMFMIIVEEFEFRTLQEKYDFLGEVVASVINGLDDPELIKRICNRFEEEIQDKSKNKFLKDIREKTFEALLIIMTWINIEEYVAEIDEVTFRDNVSRKNKIRWAWTKYYLREIGLIRCKVLCERRA